MTHFPATLLALKFVEDGHTASSAAKLAGVHRDTLRRAMRSANLQPRSVITEPVQAITPSRRQSATVALGVFLVRENGMNVSAAARLAGCSRVALSRAVDRQPAD